MYAIWYEHLGVVEGFHQPEPSGECKNNEKVEKWNHFVEVSQHAQANYLEHYGGECGLE